MLVSAALLLFLGCDKTYERRLQTTLEDMKYQQRLNDNLTAAPTKGKWEQLLIYLRPPKNLTKNQVWPLAELEPGKFDLDASFREPEKQDLYFLARVKQDKTTKKKKKGAEAADNASRKDFNHDVLDVLAKSYPVQPEDLALTKFKSTKEKSNEYRRFAFTANGKTVEVYLYKYDTYEAALIFEYPKSESKALATKIQLCLQSFAVGPRAQRYFSGATSDDDAGGSGGAPVVF
jgi:hypothetical protein